MIWWVHVEHLLHVTAVSYYDSHVLKQTSFQLHLFDVVLSYIKWFQLDHICEQRKQWFRWDFLLKIASLFNALRARRDENENDVFSKRDDHDAYFWIISNEFNLFEWGWFNQMKMIEWKWLNNFNKDEWVGKKLKIWDVVYASLLFYALCFLRLEMIAPRRKDVKRDRRLISNHFLI
jgi:hypothetical protein